MGLEEEMKGIQKVGKEARESVDKGIKVIKGMIVVREIQREHYGVLLLKRV